ncbi:MAG: peptide-methionine (R)-S-oxide reductase MsrB [Candidatus Mycalebacterium zealandia]|nr:MAG: peptide-methionine (R)-S-oxide reductase MsrB [Candidatus Mycalebacterium zealandia]
MTGKIKKTDEEWKAELTEEQFHVARRKGTEKPFTGKFNDYKEKGRYICVCCGQPLFNSDSKFDSGTGWPSFDKPMERDNVKTEQDNSAGMSRTEVMCSKCDAHLGHVFPDGPSETTGTRYCINSASLDFKKKD